MNLAARLGTFVARFLAPVSLAIWVGGFTFYSAAVLPVLHDAMPTRDAGAITRRVTDRLNAVGLGAVGLSWFAALRARRRRRLGLVTATTVLLAVLIALHALMDRHLDRFGLVGFYPWHRAYLIVSTAQWLVNLGLLTWPGANEDDP